MYVDLIHRVLQAYEVLALGQYVDEWQWDEEIGDRQGYAKEIGKRFSVQAVVTTEYDKPDPPDPTARIFILHVLGRPSYPLLRDVLGFGMTTLPYIGYGLNTFPEPWPSQTLAWNAIFLRWFWLQAPDAAIAELIQKVGLLLWTSDWHVSFGLLQGAGVDRILGDIEQLAQDRDLRPVVTQIQGGYGSSP